MSIEIIIFMLAMFAISMGIARRLSPGRYPATLLEVLLAVAAAYHILPELIFVTLGAHHCRYRDTLSTAALDLWGVLVGFAFVLVSTGSAIAQTATQPRVIDDDTDWRPDRFVAVIWMALYGAAIGYALAGGTLADHQSANYLEGGLTRTLLPVIAVATIVMVAQATRWPATCLLLGVASAALLGSRSTAAVISIGALLLFHRRGLSVSWKQIALVGSAVGACIVALSMIRSAGLRLETFDDFDTRVSKLSNWAEAPLSSTAFDTVLADFTYRFDGNSFCALVLQGQLTGSGRRPAVSEVAEVMWLTSVPAALAPLKHDQRMEALNEEELYMSAYSLPSDDYLPTLVASPLAALGPTGFCLAVLLFGACLGALDRRLSCRNTTGVVLTAGCATTLIAYEHSMQGVLVQLRSVIVLAMAIAGVRLAARVWMNSWLLRQVHSGARGWAESR